jgi:hypothetical protein
MSRSPDYGTWVTIICGIGIGLLAGWVSDHYGVNENIARAAAYTVGIFALLAAALRPAWRKPQLWIDLLVLFLLHAVLALHVMRLLDSHSIRLNWALALPFVAIEFVLFLSLLWRRNVCNSSP